MNILSHVTLLLQEQRHYFTAVHIYRMLITITFKEFSYKSDLKLIFCINALRLIGKTATFVPQSSLYKVNCKGHDSK